MGTNSAVGTPSTRTPGRTARGRLEAVTPRATRRKIAACLGKSKEQTLNNHESSEESDDEDDEDDDEEDNASEDGEMQPEVCQMTLSRSRMIPYANEIRMAFLA